VNKLIRGSILILPVLSLVVSGCSITKQDETVVTSTSSTASAENSSLSAKGAFPITKQKTTLNVLMKQAATVTDYEDNALTKFLEEKTNVHVKFTLVPDKDWITKLNLLLATNTDLPDVILGGVDNTLLVKYGSLGVFQPLNKLIDKNTVEFPKMLKQIDYLSKLITAPDGNIYGLPRINESYNVSMPSKMWMNQKFLDAVGMVAPTTTDELYNVLKAFKTKDPNKDGKADEIPLAGATTGWQLPVEGFLMSSFVQNDTLKRLTLVDGKIQAAYMTPEWREGLRYMKKLADEKLLDPMSFSQDQNQLKQLFENATPLLGAVTGGGFGAYSNPNGTRKNDYLPVSPMKGPNGVQQVIWDPYGAVTNGMFVLTNKCQGECADIAVKWADQFFDLDVTLRSRLGVPEVDWKKSTGKPGVNGKSALYEPILVWGSNQKSHWSFINPGFYPDAWSDGNVYNQDNPYEMQYFLRKATADKYEAYKKAVVPPLILTAKESEEITGMETEITTYVKENIARFVLGNRDLDKDWDSYLKDLNNMGLVRYLAIYQQAYDRIWKK
jgi:putative aldouronate transport system substrate-binding protein